MADSPNVGCVEVIYPPTPELTPQNVVEIGTTEVGSEVEKTSEDAPPNMKEIPDIPVSMSADSAGLVLLSHLCELSAKQPITEEQECSGKMSNSAAFAEGGDGRLNVIVERIQDQYFTQRTMSPFYTASVDSPECEEIEETFQSPSVKVTESASGKVRRVTKSLKFPPCFVCGGKASGSHYGVNSCEACKGFFRRYLMRKEEYKCSKGGKCEIINRNRGNCSGCRLKKCLDLGMAKEKSKLGRYTLARRTETIKEVNKLEGKEETDSSSGSRVSYPMSCPVEHSYSDPKTEVLSRKMSQNNENLLVPSLYSGELVNALVQKLKELKPFGPNINDEKDIANALRTHHEHYKVKTALFGKMTSVPSEEYYKLYHEYGIDADGRMQIIKDISPYIEGIIDRYCNFAKHIPEFLRLTVSDQRNLLKSSRYDFFVIAMHHGYSEEFQMMLGKNGQAYHIDETADKFCSRKLVMIVRDMFKRWQKLKLSHKEQAILCALTLVATDRCRLESYELVEKIQLSLVDLLQKELSESCAETARYRFGKIIDNLTMMREGSDLYMREYKELCKNKLLTNEIPLMSEFLLEEDM